MRAKFYSGKGAMNQCLHCGYRWRQRILGVRSPVCNNKQCQSKRWDKPTRRAAPETEIRSIEQLKSHVTVTTTGCWEWNHGRTSHGYGLALLDGRRVMIHRVVWFILKGSYPPREVLSCHSCDNPPCCNPDHLFQGDYSDNMRDCVDKGRHTQHEAKFCKHGHPRTPDNLYVGMGRNGRHHYTCKACHHRRTAVYRQSVKQRRMAA